MPKEQHSMRGVEKHENNREAYRKYCSCCTRVKKEGGNYGLFNEFFFRDVCSLANVKMSK